MDSGQMPLTDVAQAPVPAQEASAAGRTAVLWGVQLLGVLVVAIMTWKLVLQLRAGPNRDP